MSQNLLTGLVGAWCPSLGPSGYTLLDRSGLGTHLTWTSPSATNWQADSIAVWAASTTDAGDFIASTRRIPVTVAGWSVVQWVNARSYGGYANSIDLNRGVYTSPNVGPRCEFDGTKATWVYSANALVQGDVTVHDTATTLPSTGTWLMVAITHNGSTTSKTYQQGRPSGLTQSGAGAFIGSFGAPRLGQGYNNDRGFNGLLGGTLVYSRQLTDVEVALIYAAGPAARFVAQQRRRNYALKAAANRTYLFVNRSQIIGGGTL